MSIVDKVARIIDPDAFDESVWLDGATGKPHDFGAVERARKELHKSTAICKAVDVLKAALAITDLRQQLIDYELKGWQDLGIPPTVLQSKEARDNVAGKYDDGLSLHRRAFERRLHKQARRRRRCVEETSGHPTMAT